MQLSLLDLPWWGLVLVTLGSTHVTIAAVTIFLHRHQAHRALELHPLVSHFFRFWLWLTTGMVTKEWAAIHRKHHANCETSEDPHSPQIHGIRKVLFEGTELYRMEARNAATLKKYGHGTPDDWIERNLYAKHSVLGVVLMLAIDLVLFGPIGLTVWAVQMLWIPFFAAGVVNGVGHYWGYRNFAPYDASRNIAPWGLLIGGEELHNNHHAYATSAKFSSRWWEFDIGWTYIRVLQWCRLAKVRSVAPKIRFEQAKSRCDVDTLRSVIAHRYHVLAEFDKCSTHVALEEVHDLPLDGHAGMKRSAVPAAVRHWLHGDATAVPKGRAAALREAFDSSKVLATIYSMRQELAAVWSHPTASTEQLVAQLEDWCVRAEQSGIAAVRAFSQKLRCYA
jgi:stearoyl-CoA desaturase (delta-9 desaturase)